MLLYKVLEILKNYDSGLIIGTHEGSEVRIVEVQ